MALDLTKPTATTTTTTTSDKCIQTDKVKSVDAIVSVCRPDNKKLVETAVQTDLSNIKVPLIRQTNINGSQNITDVSQNTTNVYNSIPDVSQSIPDLSANLSQNIDPMFANIDDAFLNLIDNDLFPLSENINFPSIQSQDKDGEKQKFFNDLRSTFVADDKGNMPIHVGILKNDLKLVKRCALILSILKQSIDLPNNYNQTPLQLAVIHNANERIIVFLLDSGASVDLCDEDGNNVIHLACEHARIDALKIIAQHADKTTTLNQPNHEGLTPLMICASNGLIECAEILLYFDVDIDKRDLISGRTALFHAAENQDLSMVALLLQYHANTKIKNFFGTSPHDAMFEVEDIPETIRMLILGKSLKRKMAEDKVVMKHNKKKDDKKVELRTYARLEKIGDLKVFDMMSNKMNVQKINQTTNCKT